MKISKNNVMKINSAPNSFGAFLFMKYFSMFSGIGGFELGIHRALRPIESDISKNELQQWQCVGYSEIDKYAIQIYQRHFKEHKNYGNARDIDTKQLPNFDLLVGGFPCQSFSIAGKRGGLQDTRGTLFYEIARICADKRPRYILFENVKGLLSHDNGKTFSLILKIFSDLGYLLQWEVLNSKNFGVPQNRERVFIIGCLRGESCGQIFPIGGIKDVFNEQNAQRNDIAHTITNAEKLRGSYVIEDFYPDRVRTFEDCPTLRGDRQGLKVAAVLTPNRPEKRQAGHRMKEDGEPSFTLTGQDIHGVAYENRIRRLTPTECERLQGFPDGWTEKGIDESGKEVVISDSQRYKCLGNAVTVNVVEAIMRRFLCPKH